MVKREFKAKMVDDFRVRWLEVAAIDEDVPIDTMIFVYDGSELVEFSERVSGKTVTLVEEECLRGNSSVFEKLDGSYVIDESLFTEVP